VAVQTMAATRTQDIETTVAQVNDLYAAGADVVRVAVDSRKDVEALMEIRARTAANLAVDLQENYHLAAALAPHVDKIRYNPGHLYHHEREKPWQDKVKFLADVAGANDCALRVGVNCGSVDPAKRDQFGTEDKVLPMLASAREHCELLDRIGFSRYCVSLEDSDPRLVIEVNKRFAAERPDVPMHLGVTELCELEARERPSRDVQLRRDPAPPEGPAGCLDCSTYECGIVQGHLAAHMKVSGGFFAPSSR
jgi:(E)-4-hydroxy-3-methylbut-2-enyl-diphosphate synthase